MSSLEQAVPTDIDREATLIRMMEEYRTELIRMAYLYLGELSLAEDAVQETFLKAYAHLGRFRGESSEKTWLMRIAINACKDMRRSAWLRWRRRTVPLCAAAEDGQKDCFRDDTVLSAVMGLPPRDKQVILLRYYQQMKVADLAKALQISQSSAVSRLSRAKGRLRAALKGWYFDEE